MSKQSSSRNDNFSGEDNDSVCQSHGRDCAWFRFKFVDLGVKQKSQRRTFIFPLSRLREDLRSQVHMQVGKEALVYLSAVLTELCGTVFKYAIASSDNEIELCDHVIKNVFSNFKDFKSLCKRTVIPQKPMSLEK